MTDYRHERLELGKKTWTRTKEGRKGEAYPQDAVTMEQAVLFRFLHLMLELQNNAVYPRT